MDANITDFMWSVFTDDYENTDDSDRKQEMREIVRGIPMCLLRDYCWDVMEEHYGADRYSAFHQAVHKSIDFVELKRSLIEWLDTDEAAV